MATRRRRFLDVVSEGAGFLVVYCLLWSTGDGLELDTSCLAPLGMESGGIRDYSISASSSYDSGSVGPHHARLRNNKQGGAWCPKHMVSRDSREYLEIDLGDIFVLTGIKTQGRYGNGQGQEYAEQYMVEYWRPGLAKWVRWRDRSGKELLSGNTDTFTIVDQTLDPPVVSSKIRILPYSDHVRTVCMRIELTGCLSKDGLLNYNMPQGVARGDLDLRDKMYDGGEENGQLTYGLGQLTDGRKGKDNFKGYEWIGWRNDTPGWAGLPLEILFEFDKVRNFSAAHLYTNNLFSKDVQVFSHARAFLSLNGYKFSPEPVHFSYMPDLVMEHSRNVTIKLHQRIGKFLKLQLYFASRWILLSEVSFESTVVGGNFTQDPDVEMGATLPDFVGREYPIQRDEVKAAVSKGAPARNIITNEDPTSPHQKSTSNQASESKSYIGLVIGILTVIILVLTSAIFFIILRNQRLRNTLTTLPVIGEDLKDLENEKSTINEDNKDHLYAEGGSSYYSQNILSSCPNYADIPDLVSKGYQMQEVDQTPHSDHLYRSKPPPLPPPPQNYYTREEICRPGSLGVPPPLSPRLMNRSTARSRLILPLSPHKIPESDFGSRDPDDDCRINKISSEKLRVIKKIGKGRFGDLHLCEITVGTPSRDSDLGALSAGGVKLCVVCTVVDESFLDEFHRETDALSKLKDKNVAALMGASLEEPPYYSIREHAQFGDLCQFLQDHVAESTTSVAANASILSYGCLVYMATQIASGMKYLESLKFVHKDLAARNCLVGTDYEIKISDLGALREIYSQDYCQIAGSSLVPLRWMAWESALLGNFSNKSDVWSFAVLLWEILTFAREQPFEFLSDEKVLENLAHYYQNNGQQIYLDIPHNCPKEIFDLMVECWNRNESDRPTFREIHLFLQRKNLGYKPNAH